MEQELKLTDFEGDIISVLNNPFGVSVCIAAKNNPASTVFLDNKQINQLITHLSEQLTKIGVQVDILKENQTVYQHLKKQSDNGNCTYWVIESALNGKPIYWTGGIPHLSERLSNNGQEMWTDDIHKSLKHKTKQEAEHANVTFEIFGLITEHLDIDYNK